jgi:hypothetical protein
MKTLLSFKLKNKIRKFFGLDRPKKPSIIVRMDLLNPEVSDETQSKIREIIGYDVESAILKSRDEKSIKDEFNELPFSRLSEPAMREIIKIVRMDLDTSLQNIDKYATQIKESLDVLGKETETVLDKS